MSPNIHVMMYLCNFFFFCKLCYIQTCPNFFNQIKYSVNATDEESLLPLKKSLKVWSTSLPPHVHMVKG